MNKKIMVVDDEPDILTALRIIFENYGYDVTTVETGGECIEELKGGFEGVVLIDIMMPKMDGWATIKKIVDKELTKNIAIEVITGKGTKDHEKMCGLEPYIFDYLVKPFNPEELISSVETLSFKLFSRNVKR